MADLTTMIINIIGDNQNISVDNKYDKVNVIPDFSGTTYTDIRRNYGGYNFK